MFICNFHHQHPMNGQMPMMIPQPMGMPMASLDKPPPGAPNPYFFPPIPQMPPMVNKLNIINKLHHFD